MDVRGVKERIGTRNRFRLAQSALQNFGWDLLLVVVDREQEANGFFENVLVNRNGNIRIFTNLAPACTRLGIEERAVVVK